MQTRVLTPPLCGPSSNDGALVSYSQSKVYDNIEEMSHGKKYLDLVFPTRKEGIEKSNKEGDCGCHLISLKHKASPLFFLEFLH